MNLDSKANLRDYETLVELLSEYDLKQKSNLEYYQARQVIRSDAEFVGKHAEEAGHQRGIDIPTSKPLLPAKTKQRKL